MYAIRSYYVEVFDLLNPEDRSQILDRIDIPATAQLFNLQEDQDTLEAAESITIDRLADILDEVANLSLTTQAKLLRVLQEREVTPIGGTKPVPIDIRLVAATNRSLKEMLAEGTFREDLYVITSYSIHYTKLYEIQALKKLLFSIFISKSLVLIPPVIIDFIPI